MADADVTFTLKPSDVASLPAPHNKPVETDGARLLERTQRLLKITSALADAVTTQEVFEAIVDHVAAALKASTAGLWLVSDDGKSLQMVRYVGYSARASKAIERVPMDLQPSLPVLDAVRRAEPVWIASQEALIREYPHLAGTVTAGLSYRVCCLPLFSNGKTIGGVGITIEEERDATEDERSFLLLVARHASQALARLRLFDAERRSRAAADAAAHRMNVLGQASRAFGEADIDHTQRLDRIVSETGKLFESHTSINLLETDGRLHTAAHYHPDPKAHEAIRALAKSSPIDAGEGISGTVMSTGKSVLIERSDPSAIAARAAAPYRALLERFPIYALIVTPLRVRGRIIGTLSASRVSEAKSYDQADLSMFEALAERAASAIETSRLHKETQEARSRAEQLYRFADAAVTSERLEQVFDAALSAIGKALGTERAAVLLFDDEGVMRFKSWRGLSDEYRQAVEGHSPWQRDAVAPQALVVEDVTTDAAMSSFAALFGREKIGSLAFIPLVSRGRLLGKFMVYDAHARQYSAGELDLANAIANHLGSIVARFTAVNELEKTIRYNELFAGVLAHDLRNPLSAMTNAAQLLLMRQEGQGDPAGARPLSRILSSGQRMTRMIDQLLDFTQARVGGGLTISRVATNLADLCKQAVAEVELAFPDRKIECHLQGNQDGTWDPDRLLQVISNLVANATQHGSPEAPVVITIDGGQPDAVVFQIHNKGAIPPSLLPSLFDPFRGTQHRRSDSRGLGLGLFIVKEIIRAHEGAVQVASTEETGTSFTLRLPRQATHERVEGR